MWKSKRVLIQSLGTGLIQDARAGANDGQRDGLTEENGAGAADAAAGSGTVNPAMENMDPLKRRIANPPRRGIFRGIIRLITKKFKRVLTAEEAAALKEAEYRKTLYKVLEAEAKTAESRMVSSLTRLGICHENKGGGGMFVDRYTKIKFSRVLMEPNALWFKVSRRLPFGVSYNRLTDEEITFNLSMAVGHHVVAHFSEEAGLWFMIERASGKFGIPNHVNLADMWAAIPASRDNLTIPVGIAQNGKMIYESMADMIHCLIAGTTGGGKSNFLNVMLCTLIRRNRPDQLEIVLVDLKGGLEFGFYEGLPHLKPVPDVSDSGIVNDRELVPDLLGWLIHEGERRMQLLKAARVQNIGQYNAHRKKGRLPRMLVVIDEWADVMLSASGRKAEERLMNIVQRMRAVGLHVVLATQTPSKQVISLAVRANLPAKFGFNCSNFHASVAILGNGAAHNIQPVGRCVTQTTVLGEVQIQTPFISPGMVDDTVRGAITGDHTTQQAAHDVTPAEVMRWAIRENNGWLAVDVLYKQYRARGLTIEELRGWLDDWEDQENLEVDTSLYRVQPSAGSRARRFVALEDSENE